MRNNREILLLIMFVFFGFTAGIISANEKTQTVPFKQESNNINVLTIEQFIALATTKDTVFEAILIDELALKYKKDFKLPAKDLVLSVKSEYDVFLGKDKEDPSATVSLSKLFPNAGTSLTAGYKSNPSFTSTTNASEFTFSISQPIAENAFGKSTRFYDQILGLEIDVAKHQIIEAYEDYMATIIGVYYDWYEAYANLRIGQSSYQENLKLLDNIKDREKSKIALPIDVNKVNIQVLAKKEKLSNLTEAYDRALNTLETAIRYEGSDKLIPKEPFIYSGKEVEFASEYKDFVDNSRTYQVLRLLEEKSSFEVDKNANELLPSINLLIGYKVEGDDFSIKNEDNMLYAGISMDWPIGEQVEEAEYETSKITLSKTRLTTKNTHFQLHTDLKNLHRQIIKEKEIIEIIEQKIELAKAVLVDETENYSFGKVTLNEFIQAVNTLDDNRFNKTLHSVEMRKLIVEWLRMTDQLIRKDPIVREEVR
ncbi:MAG: TolC family protein [Candidatus Omnitrophica bacterium]|nr:TolC family protein [Candidatus Omnitrophota bacterium]